MQPYMKNSSNQNSVDQSEDDFHYDATVPGYFFLSHKCNPNWTTNAGNSEAHKHCEIVIYLQDMKCLFVNDTMYVSQAPCIFTFRPGEYHYAIHSKPGRHERFLILLYQDSFFALPNGRELLRCLFDRESGQHNMIVLPEEDNREVFRLLNSILSQNDSELPEKQSLQLSDMIRFLSLLNRHYLSVSATDTNEMPELLRQIVSYIGSNLIEPLRVADLAQSFNISQSTLERLFRNSLTMSPKEYIIRRRMDVACECLRQGQSVTAAFSNAGFGDYSHFIADFRKIHGITPAEYARQHRHEG